MFCLSNDTIKKLCLSNNSKNDNQKYLLIFEILGSLAIFVIHLLLVLNPLFEI